MRPSDTVEARPAWLSQSILRVTELPAAIPLRAGVERLTLQLLRSIEADHLPVPWIYSTRKGVIRIVWEHGDRTLCLSVTDGDRFRAGRISGCMGLPFLSIREDRVAKLRAMIAWLYPGVNQGTASSVAGWEGP